MAGLYVRAQANEYKQLQEASKQQMAALGANGPRRIDAIAQFLTGHLGEGPAKSLLGVLFTKTQVEAFEGLMRLVTSRGVPAPRNTGASGTGRDAPEIRSFGDAVRVMTAATEAAKSSGGRSRRR
jgi:hypothetical protein